jgi:hypothetical protein
MQTPFFFKVDQHTARNPVARALAKSRTEKTLRNFVTALYLMEEGKSYEFDMRVSQQALQVTLHLQPELPPNQSEVINSGIEILSGLIRDDFKWKSSEVAALDIAITCALSLMIASTSHEVCKAWIAYQKQTCE